MADILSIPFVRHLRADVSSHILHYRNARLLRSGRGLAFWFNPMSASVAEVPVDDRELSLAFHGRSVDFQDVTAQGVITYRVTEPTVLAERVDFTIDLRTGAYLRDPLDKIAHTLSQLAQEHAWTYIAETPVRRILTEGHARIRERIEAALTEDAGVEAMGIAVTSVRISYLKPSCDVERALEAPTREQIQQEADEAAFARRALAVEKERAIQENELQNQIELSRREEQLIAQRGQNARRQATEEADAQRIAAEATAERTRIASEAAAARTRLQAEARSAEVRLVEGAQVEVETARMDVYRAMPATVLAALAAQQLAGKLQRIEHLNVGADALGPLLQNLLEAGTQRLSAGAAGSGK